MLPGDPVGFLLTWATYGTHLHGDARGSVDRSHNRVGDDLLPANPMRVAQEQARLRSSPVIFARAARQLVDQTIRDHCRIRDWELVELNVRTNHVHVVVRFAGLQPDRMSAQFKSYCTRALRRAGYIGPKAVAWAEKGSGRYLWNEIELANAAAYVRDAQDVPRE